MANSKTDLGKVPLGYYHAGMEVVTNIVRVVIDTIDEDFTVYTPDANSLWAIVGLLYQEASAHNIGFKSGTTALITLERPANDPLAHRVGSGVLLSGLAKGDALVIRSSVAISELLFTVQEYKYLKFF